MKISNNTQFRVANNGKKYAGKVYARTTFFNY